MRKILDTTRQGIQTNRQFADCLALGADFPSLQFTLKEMKSFNPLWFDSWNEGLKKPCLSQFAKLADPDADEQADAPQPPVQPGEQTLLPLAPNLPRSTRGGSGGLGGR